MSKKEQWLTVNEVAEQAGITTQAVYKRLQTSWQELVKVENGRKLVSSSVLLEFQPTETTNVGNQTNQEPTRVANLETIDKLLKTLQQQLEVKDKQINELNERLKEANELNKHNQMLLMQNMKQLAAPTAEKETIEAEYEQEKEYHEPQQDEAEQQQKKAPFWRRWFK